MVSPSELVEAKLRGMSMEGILQVVREGALTKNESTPDHEDFLETMLVEIKEAVNELELAIFRKDFSKIRETSHSLQEIFLMVEDSCGS